MVDRPADEAESPQLMAENHFQRTNDGEGACTRVLGLHSATVVTISGDIDAANIQRVSDWATQFVPIGNAVILDLTRVGFFAVQSVSLFFAVDDVCRNAEVQWALVSSPAVNRAARLADSDFELPTVSSVPGAVQHLIALARAGRDFSPHSMPS